METGLHERDRAGVQDFVLLENYESEDAFIGNLKKRFQENLIYVSAQNSIDFPALFAVFHNFNLNSCLCLYFLSLTTHPLL